MSLKVLGIESKQLHELWFFLNEPCKQICYQLMISVQLACRGRHWEQLVYPEEVSCIVISSIKMTLQMTPLTPSLVYLSLCNLACTHTWPRAKRWHAKMCHCILLSFRAWSEIGAFLTHVDSAHSTDACLCFNNSCSCKVLFKTRSVNRSFREGKSERVMATKTNTAAITATNLSSLI